LPVGVMTKQVRELLFANVAEHVQPVAEWLQEQGFAGPIIIAVAATNSNSVGGYDFRDIQHAGLFEKPGVLNNPAIKESQSTPRFYRGCECAMLLYRIYVCIANVIQ
jgi:hypothetical protein